MTQTLTLPSDREWFTIGEAMRAAGIQPGERVRVGNMYTLAEWRERDRWKNSQYFLVLNGRSEKPGLQTIEPQACDKCGAGRYPSKPHAYLTYMCIERPWSGLDDALWAFAVQTGDLMMERAVIQWRNFATLHPWTARQWDDPASQVLLSFAVGSTVPIDRDYARRLASAINGKRPPMPFYI
jgi:hypothetical protein